MDIKEKEVLIPKKKGHHRPFSGGCYESLNYLPFESRIYQDVNRSIPLSTMRLTWAFKWMATILIGFLTALVAFFIDFFVREISKYKFDWFGDVQDAGNKNILWLLIYYAGFNAVFVGIGSALVAFGEPVAGGSGIPEVKCYLNGVKIPHVVRLKTLVAKACGVLLSVGGGMCVGKEGPMIHSGAILGAGVSQGKATFLPIDTGFFKMFRNDATKRDFVAAGSAAGVAAAFGAPIGGVLFALEEGASFWDVSLTWRTFLGAMISTLTLNFFDSGTNPESAGGWGRFNNPGLVDFGSFREQTQGGYSLANFPVFLLLGIGGGLLGALFNFLNEQLTKFRMRHVKQAWKRWLEAILIGGTTAAVGLLVTYYFPFCRDGEPFDQSHSFFCGEDRYSEMESLFLPGSWGEGIRHLFHAPKKYYSLPQLAIFFALYFVLSCWTYGIAVASGLFVPSLLTGATYGRFVGELMVLMWPHHEIDVGAMALVGAASYLGGVVRMTISLTVIIMESTNDSTYALPLMVCLMLAKVTGDMFGKGIYDLHIALKQIPLLEFEPPAKFAKFRASDIMSSPVNTLHIYPKVGDVVRSLQATTHSGFPVVGVFESRNKRIIDNSLDESLDRSDLERKCCGIALRHVLVMMIKHRLFYDSRGVIVPDFRPLTVDDFDNVYPRYPNIDDIALPSPVEQDALHLDLSDYMEPYPHLVQQTCPLNRVFRLFRVMAMRHLIVVNIQSEVVGMITREDLAKLEHMVEGH